MRVNNFHRIAEFRKRVGISSAVPVVLSLMMPAIAASEEIFRESFNDLPDYTSSEELNLEGWSFRRNGEVNWSPENGHPDRHDAFEILASNSDKARGGTGKSFVAWRESYDPGWQQWNSDGILMKYFPEGYDQIYVEFYIKFSPKWTEAGTSKLFRMFSWSGEGSPFQFFADGNSGPIFLWDYANSNYGVRNVHSYRGGPHGENYDFDSSNISDTPRPLVNRGDLSLNFTGDTEGMAEDGGYPKIRDKVKGGYISDDLNQTVEMDQIYGDEWTKLAFFAKMNSSPGKADGKIRQWLDGELIFKNDSVVWVDQNPEGKMVKWNSVAIGGNDFFQEYPNSERHEEWYSIDDVLIASDIPKDLGVGDGVSSNPPAPPTSINIE